MRLIMIIFLGVVQVLTSWCSTFAGEENEQDSFEKECEAIYQMIDEIGFLNEEAMEKIENLEKNNRDNLADYFCISDLIDWGRCYLEDNAPASLKLRFFQFSTNYLQKTINWDGTNNQEYGNSAGFSPIQQMYHIILSHKIYKKFSREKEWLENLDKNSDRLFQLDQISRNLFKERKIFLKTIQKEYSEIPWRMPDRIVLSELDIPKKIIDEHINELENDEITLREFIRKYTTNTTIKKSIEDEKRLFSLLEKYHKICNIYDKDTVFILIQYVRLFYTNTQTDVKQIKKLCKKYDISPKRQKAILNALPTIEDDQEEKNISKKVKMNHRKTHTSKHSKKTKKAEEDLDE